MSLNVIQTEVVILDLNRRLLSRSLIGWVNHSRDRCALLLELLDLLHDFRDHGEPREYELLATVPRVYNSLQQTDDQLSRDGLLVGHEAVYLVAEGCPALLLIEDQALDLDVRVAPLI